MRQLSVWEEELLDALLEVLGGFSCSEAEDSWFWRPHENGLFLVNSPYRLLDTKLVTNDEWNDI